MVCDLIYRRPHLEHANNLVSLIFERRTVTMCKRFVTINYFLLSVLSCRCFHVGFEAVSEPPVPELLQRKEHNFQALTLEKTWDLNKSCTILIHDESR